MVVFIKYSDPRVVSWNPGSDCQSVLGRDTEPYSPPHWLMNGRMWGHWKGLWEPCSGSPTERVKNSWDDNERTGFNTLNDFMNSSSKQMSSRVDEKSNTAPRCLHFYICPDLDFSTRCDNSCVSAITPQIWTGFRGSRGGTRQHFKINTSLPLQEEAQLVCSNTCQRSGSVDGVNTCHTGGSMRPRAALGAKWSHVLFIEQSSSGGGVAI